MFRLGIAPKEIFLAYLTQFIFLKIRLVPGNVVMFAIDICRKRSITGNWIYGITWNHVYFNISVLFIGHTTSILKFLFPTPYCFCLDSNLGGCVVVHYSYLCLLLLSSLLLLLIFVCVVIVVVNIMLMFSILVLLCMPYFTVNSVGKWYYWL